MANVDEDRIHYDPWDPEVIDDPYPHYRRLRDEAPAYYVDSTGYWVLSRYDDVLHAVRNWEVFSSQWGSGGGSPSFMGGGDGYRSSSPSMIGSDPPDHTRLRRIVQRDLTPSNIARWEQRIRAYADGLVRDFVEANERGEADLMRDIATPLPSIAIAEILGIPPEDREEFKEMTETALGGASLDPEVRARAAGGGPNLFEYFERVVAEKRKNLGDDLMSLFIRASERGEDTLTHEEIIAQCHLFLIGGHETTTNVIGNAGRQAGILAPAARDDRHGPPRGNRRRGRRLRRGRQSERRGRDRREQARRRVDMRVARAVDRQRGRMQR